MRQCDWVECVDDDVGLLKATAELDTFEWVGGDRKRFCVITAPANDDELVVAARFVIVVDAGVLVVQFVVILGCFVEARAKVEGDEDSEVEWIRTAALRPPPPVEKGGRFSLDEATLVLVAVRVEGMDEVDDLTRCRLCCCEFSLLLAI